MLHLPRRVIVQLAVFTVIAVGGHHVPAFREAGQDIPQTWQTMLLPPGS